MTSGKLLSVTEIGTHNKPSDCWLVIDGQVWDFTEFHQEHPGGSSSECNAFKGNVNRLALTEREVILKYAGRDATKAYNEVHSPSVIRKNLHSDKLKGHLDASTVGDEWLSPEENTRATSDSDKEGKPPLNTLINAHDFEVVASKTASKKTWAFYSSAATDLLTRDANKSCFNRIWFRPRVMRNVRSVNTQTNIMGVDSNLPLFVSPTAMAKLIHVDGECAVARACAGKGILQGVRTQREKKKTSNDQNTTHVSSLYRCRIILHFLWKN